MPITFTRRSASVQIRISAIAICALALVSSVSAQTETLLHSFNLPTGDYPFSGVITDGVGDLYGTTALGGTGGAGVVYKVDASGHYTVLYNFSSAGEGSPQGTLARDRDGNLYGTTSYGGQVGLGTVFKLDPGGQETVLYSFLGGSDGQQPITGVVRDAAGNLFGTTNTGGTAGYGVVYKVTSSGQETILHSFAGGPDGATPLAGVTLDSAGNVYGTTEYGGTANNGVIYKIDPVGQETILYRFSGGLDGSRPYGGVTLDTAGNLYGTTFWGGSSNGGVVFKLDPVGNETVLHQLGMTPGDGSNPSVTLVFDAVGNLYGTTVSGGALNNGTIFKISPAAHQESIVYSFNEENSAPGPVLISHRHLYITNKFGGRYGTGFLLRIGPRAHRVAEAM